MHIFNNTQLFKLHHDIFNDTQNANKHMPAGLPLLDRSASQQHQYLGVCDELHGGFGWLEEGEALDLPVLVLWGEQHGCQGFLGKFCGAAFRV